MKRIYTAFMAAAVLSALGTSCGREPKYPEIKDLFQPRLLNESVVAGNSITTVWYEVTDAVSYTVGYYTDNYYNNLFMEFDVDEPFVFFDDIPYATRFYIRIRSNAKDPYNNSAWTYTNAATEPRPPFERIVTDVARADIGENDVVVRWTVDAENPADSISLVPTMNPELPSVKRYLTEQEMAQGAAEITGLEKNTLYAINLYDTTKPRKYDRPYNTISFRTAGPSAGTIIIGRDDDLSAILAAANDDVTVPEGAEYFLPEGSYYKVSPFTIKKGFVLKGSTEGVMPQIEMGGNWNIQEGVYLSSLSFENIEFFQTIDASYFFNSGNSWEIDEINIFNCRFRAFQRGFWRHQGADKYKRIGNFTMEECILDQCMGHSGPFGTFSINSGGADNIEKAVFRNCTFMREAEPGRARNLFDYGNSAYPIHLEFKNVTLYNYAASVRLINIPGAAGSTFIFENMLIASASGEVCSMGANTTTSYANNYFTSDYLPGTGDYGEKLSVSAADLFVNPAEGDLTISDPSSPVVINGAGHRIWWP